MRTAVPLAANGTDVVPVLRRILPCGWVTLVAQDDTTGLRHSCRWPGTDGRGPVGEEDPAGATVLDWLLAHPNQLDPVRLDAALLLPLGADAGWVLTRVRGEFSEAELDAASLIAPGLRLRWRLCAYRPEGLTTRELDVLRLVAAGLTASAVARHCRISARTVHKHLENAYAKLGCHDRITAVLILRDAGLLGGGVVRSA
ncbi:helix-turn-helix transcriptional regulator [Couchioplanes caeruleus]|uniref:helix-turn-helix transcriptional regulator n=1 Tax=Couchioplanes caeruleus TaxID=56438 RepID=UPI0020C14FC2|nr:helix-turn-helix transcriptional regulator [Couchioplanes caeruleus]UQU67634.1 helix-turn-helix transcriptional regulator [Couchioplanes caeruleus]